MFNFINRNNANYQNTNNQNVQSKNELNSNETKEQNNLSTSNSNIVDNNNSISNHNENVISNSQNIATNNYNKNYKTLNNTNVVNFDTLQKARQDLIGELGAIIEYDNHIHTTNVEIAKETWEDIRNEELVHVGELISLILYLAPYQKELIDKGREEFEERLKNLKN